MKKPVRWLLAVYLFGFLLTAQGRQQPDSQQKTTPPQAHVGQSQLLRTPQSEAQQATQSQPQQAVQSQPQEAPRSFAPLLKKTIAFITTEYQDGNATGQARGTAFFLAVEDKRLGENGGFVYLITNRHMVEPEVEGRRVEVRRMALRLNLKSPVGGVHSAEGVLPLGRTPGWYFPKSESVDLAVIPLAPDAETFDYAPFPASLLATGEVIKSQGIAEGDAVLFAGFFYQFTGQKKMQPIVRQGILAMMPDEELETTLHKPGRLFLADVHLFGGNSGAPIFVNVGGLRGRSMSVGGFPYRLLGVVSGYFYETQDFQLQVATTLSGTVNANSGISVVVPADELKTLLDSPELRSLREAAIARKAK